MAELREEEIIRQAVENKKQEEIITIKLPRPFAELLSQFTDTRSNIEKTISISLFNRDNNTNSLNTRIRQALSLEESDNCCNLDWVYENKK